MAHPTVRFVFSPALYPKTPLVNTPVFVHGILTEVRVKPNEITLKGKDEKGDWCAYVEQYVERFEIGQRVRAYGIVSTQPDGNIMLSAKWVKTITEEEYHYCEKETTRMWETTTNEYPVILTLNVFVAPMIEKNNTAHSKTKEDSPPSVEEETDFIPAAQFKVEREYL